LFCFSNFFKIYSALTRKANNILFDRTIPQAYATAFRQFLFVKHQADLARHHDAFEADDIPSGDLKNFQESFEKY
jgi:hypothetical protein